MIPGTQIRLRGNAASLLVLREPPGKPFADSEALLNVEIAIQVQPDMNELEFFPIVAQLIATDMMAKQPVLVVRTNLRDMWMFFWVCEPIQRDSEEIAAIAYTAVSSPERAFELMRNVLQSGKDAAAVSPLQRRKLVDTTQTLEGMLAWRR